MKRPLILVASILAAVLIVAGVSPRADAAVIGFAVDTSKTLYSVDFTTASATLIGSTGFFFEALAISPSGNLFGTSTAGSLYSINKTTGVATLIGNTGLGNIEGLDFNGATLLGTNFSNPTTFYSINTGNASPTPVVSTGQGVTRAMAVQSPTTALITSDSPTFQSLVSVNLTTGANSVLGTLAEFIAAMDFDPSSGTLYGLTDDGDIVIINQANGSLTLVGSTGTQFWLGLAIPVAAAVPEPATLVLFGAALTGLAGRLAWRNRRRV